jgi:hypothetical protein
MQCEVCLVGSFAPPFLLASVTQGTWRNDIQYRVKFSVYHIPPHLFRAYRYRSALYKVGNQPNVNKQSIVTKLHLDLIQSCLWILRKHGGFNEIPRRIWNIIDRINSAYRSMSLHMTAVDLWISGIAWSTIVPISIICPVPVRIGRS